MVKKKHEKKNAMWKCQIISISELPGTFRGTTVYGYLVRKALIFSVFITNDSVMVS